MGDNGDKKAERILQGIQYLIRDNEHLREDLKEYSRQATEDRKRFSAEADKDRKQAAEDRKQAAEDRHEMKDIIRGIRQALAVIGKRGGEFVEIQKQQAETLKLQ